jgi:trans-aconitate methyltransferase
LGEGLHHQGREGSQLVQENPAPSLDLIAKTGATTASAIIDVDGGASRLVDALIKRSFRVVTVLDLSQAALVAAKDRLSSRADQVQWIVADVTVWEPQAAAYDVWHDRAAFHFLTEERDRKAYVVRETPQKGDVRAPTKSRSRR